MDAIGTLIGLSKNASGKIYGINYAEKAENLIIQNGVLEPRSGQHTLSQSNQVSTCCFGIHPIKLTTAKYSAIIIVGDVSPTNMGIFVYRTPRRLRVGL